MPEWILFVIELMKNDQTICVHLMEIIEEKTAKESAKKEITEVEVL